MCNAHNWMSLCNTVMLNDTIIFVQMTPISRSLSFSPSGPAQLPLAKQNISSSELMNAIIFHLKLYFERGLAPVQTSLSHDRKMFFSPQSLIMTKLWVHIDACLVGDCRKC